MNLEIFWNLLILSFRDAKKIDKHLYHELYLRSKGNNFKNKKTLMEYIFKKKSENKRAKQLAYVSAFFAFKEYVRVRDLANSIRFRNL